MPSIKLIRTFYYLTITTLSSVLFMRCHHEALTFDSTEISSQIRVIQSGTDIRDLAVNNTTVYFLQDNRNIGVYNKQTETTTYLNELNSSLVPSNVIGLELADLNRIMLCDKNNGISFMYSLGIRTHVAIRGLVAYNPSCNLAFADEGHVTLPDRTYGRFRYSETNELKDRATSVAYCNDTIWIGTVASGLRKVTPIGLRLNRTVTHDVIESDSVVRVKFDYNQDLWVLTRGGLSHKLKDGSWKVFTNPPDVRNNEMCILPNRVLISTDKGVYILKNDAITALTQLNNNLSNKYIHVLEVDANDNCWIGTRNGLYTIPLTNVK